MGIQHSVWKIGEKPTALKPSALKDEKLLETMIEANPTMLADEWMIIGRQVQTTYGGYIDLLAIAPDASLIVIELKRNRTPREVVAQTLDYASWVQELDSSNIAGIYDKYSKGGSLVEDFKSRFGFKFDEEELNQSHQLVIVAAEVDPSTERILKYLSDRSISINAMFFEVFQNDEDQFLVRNWFVDPAKVQSEIGSSKNKEPWNGEYFVSFGDDQTRNWEDARKYGFISAGGGAWYSRTLAMLNVGDRIWVRIPGKGYVGVGKVTATSTPFDDFLIVDGGSEIPFSKAKKSAKYGEGEAKESQEFFVKVDWLKTVALEDAYDELGFFGNQNSVCRPTVPGWRSTVDKLKSHFKVN